jgi:hypothetical protein
MAMVGEMEGVLRVGGCIVWKQKLTVFLQEYVVQSKSLQGQERMDLPQKPLRLESCVILPTWRGRVVVVAGGWNQVACFVN